MNTQTNYSQPAGTQPAQQAPVGAPGQPQQNQLFSFSRGFDHTGKYSKNDWSNRETYYLGEVGNLYIPTSCTTTDVASISAKISNLLSEARWDFMTAKKGYDYWNTVMDAEEKIQYTQIKASSTAKITVDETKGLVLLALSDPLSPICNKYLHGTASVTGTLNIYEARYKFMDSVIKILSDKSSTLILQASMLKLESSSGNSNYSRTSNDFSYPEL